MTSPVYSKSRRLIDAVSITATVNLPAFPSAGSRGDPLVFAGAMKGAHIGGISWDVTDYDSLTTINAKLQHSEDGENWEDVDATNLAFTELSADGNEDIDVPSDTFFQRFIRVAFTVEGSGSATVTVKLHYMQCGPRDRLSPPGQPAVNA